jgi:hypothetical protein
VKGMAVESACSQQRMRFNQSQCHFGPAPWARCCHGHLRRRHLYDHAASFPPASAGIKRTTKGLLPS